MFFLLIATVNRLLFLPYESLFGWVILKALALCDSSGLLNLFLLPFVVYASLLLFAFICASLHLPLASFSVVSLLSPLSFGALDSWSDCIWHDLYNGFPALSAPRGISSTPEYFPTPLRVHVFFPVHCYWWIYLPFFGCLPPLAVTSKLCHVRNSSPWAALQRKPVIWLHGSQFHPQSLKSRSAPLFINCCLTTVFVFPLLLTELLQCRTSFYKFWSDKSLKGASKRKQKT